MSKSSSNTKGTLSSRRRWVTKRTAVALASGVALTGVSAVVASAAVPTFPDNIVVFPERDFVSLEGYQEYVGQTATVEVLRGSTVMGSAQRIIEAGDHALEVNHPGGACWGDGTNLKVTPDIRPGDKVVVKIGTNVLGDTVVGSATAGPAHAKGTGTTVIVEGTYGAGLNKGQAEQRIVNPDLEDHFGRRDVRALPGPMTPFEKGGYASSLEYDVVDVDGNGTPNTGTFRAIYEFDTAEAAAVARNTGVERFLQWQVEDGAGNRQGLTISEYGEFGGPGMGGCPAGPADVAAPKASYGVVRSADKTKLAVNWTPADPIPGAAAVSGYNVQAIKADGTFVGARVAATATSATIAVDPAVADYKVEVRSMTDNNAKMGEPFTLAPSNTPTQPTGDTTRPAVTSNPALSTAGPVETNSLTLATESSASIYYTTDGKSVLLGDLPSDSAKLYTGPIAITQATDIHAVAIDQAGNVSDQIVGKVQPPATQAPGSLTQPTGLVGTAGSGSVDLKWDAVPNATSYQVTVYNADGTQALPALQQPGEVNTTSQKVAGLNGSTAYQFTVTAINAGGRSTESAKVRVLLPEQLTIATARWKTGDMRITGTSSALSGTVRVYRVTSTGARGTQIGTLAAALTAAVAPATGTTYDWRLRTGVPTTNPGRVIVVSSNGGTAGPFTVANG